MKKEHCAFCGASLMVNEYMMSATLVSAMMKMSNNRMKPFRQMQLTKSEYAVVTKLKHWGFIEKVCDETGKILGIWILTEAGEMFLAGKLKAPKKIKYFRDKVIETEGETDVFSVCKTAESKEKYIEAMKPFRGELGT